MSKETQGVFLKLSGAIVIDGEVVRAGSLVEVSQAEAKNLLHRGKATLATERDGAPAGNGDEGEVDLSKLSKAQLVERATALMIADAEKLPKAEILAALEARAGVDQATA